MELHKVETRTITCMWD